MPRDSKPASDVDADAVAAAIQKLRPEEAEFFLHKLERAIARRRVQLWGYLGSLAVWAIAMFFAMAYYASADPSSFRGWVFLLPFAAVGVVLWVMGALADRVGRAPTAPTVATAGEPAVAAKADDKLRA
jgi:lipopolysaccharide export LptBFGC system permease protein LptF